MSTPGSFPAPYVPSLNSVPDAATNGWSSRPRWWLHILLLLMTVLTSTVMGMAFVRSFQQNRPVDVVAALNGYAEVWREPSLLLVGLPFSLTLVAILLSHELGHFLTCVHYRVDASPPYFVPFAAPIGTLGAFIRIRAPIYSRRILFDIAVAGPLAGFAVLVPALILGIAHSKVIPGIANEGELVFGVPLLVHLLEGVFFPGVPPADIYLHPVARAAWVGILATALNLLPIGQLDGGHILYSFLGEKTRLLSRILVVCLIPLAFFSLSWLLWALFLFLFGMRHPFIYDQTEMGPARRNLGLLALVIFVLCFTVAPVR